ncbi:MAG: hypothetical protein U0R19_37880 [Bryobacteraceae bacterium]
MGPQPRRRFCAVRASVAGYFTSADEFIHIGFSRLIGDPSPNTTYIHELVHKDLTQATLMGHYERFVARLLEYGKMSNAIRHHVQTLLDVIMERSTLVHEGTALYISLANLEVLGGPQIASVRAALPADYDAHVNVLERNLLPLTAFRGSGNVTDHDVTQTMVVDVIAKACAFTILNTDLRDALDQSSTPLEALHCKIPDYDGRFIQLLDSLARSGSLSALLASVRSDVSALRRRESPSLNERALSSFGEKLIAIRTEVERQLCDIVPGFGPPVTVRSLHAVSHELLSELNRNIEQRQGHSAIELKQGVYSTFMPLNVRSASHGQLCQLWFGDAPREESSAVNLGNWLRDIVAMGRSSGLWHLVHILIHSNTASQDETLPNGTGLRAGETVFHVIRRLLPVSEGGTDVDPDTEHKTERVLARSHFLKRIEVLSEGLRRSLGEDTRLLAWHVSLPSHEVATESLVEYLNLWPRDPAILVLFHFDECGSTVFSNIVRTLAATRDVVLYRSSLFTGALSPLVATERDSGRRYCLLTPADVAIRMEANIFARGQVVDGKPYSVVQEYGDRPEVHMALDFIYHERWWRK